MKKRLNIMRYVLRLLWGVKPKPEPDHASRPGWRVAERSSTPCGGAPHRPSGRLQVAFGIDFAVSLAGRYPRGWSSGRASSIIITLLVFACMWRGRTLPWRVGLVAWRVAVVLAGVGAFTYALASYRHGSPGDALRALAYMVELVLLLSASVPRWVIGVPAADDRPLTPFRRI